MKLQVWVQREQGKRMESRQLVLYIVGGYTLATRPMIGKNWSRV